MKAPAYRILLVEDEPIIAAGIATKLKQLGYELAGQAASGENAVRLAESTEPDLVLMDISLEGRIDGIEAAGRIRTKRDVPVIFLTAYADETTVARATSHDPFGYVVKPITDRELYGAIEVSRHRYELDREIRQREERYRMLTEVLSDYAFGLTIGEDPADDRCEWSVGSPAILLGHGSEGVSGLGDLLKVCHPDDATRLRAYLQELRSLGSGRLEFRTLIEAEQPRWIKIDARTVKERAGNVAHLYAACQDVTDLRQAEATLEEREIELGRIVQTMQQGIWVGDADGVCIYVNEAVVEMTGYTRDELVGERSLPTLIDADTAKPDHPFETALNSRHGPPRPVLVTPRVVVEDGRLRGSFYLITDLSQQNARYRRSERQRNMLDAAFRALPVSGALVDVSSNTIVRATESFAVATGRDATKLDGSGLFALVDYRDLDQLNLVVAIASGRLSRAEVALRTGEGETRRFLVESRSIPDEPGLILLTVEAV